MRVYALCAGLLLMALPSVGQHTIAEQYLFESINQERAAAGLPALAWSVPLTTAARYHAQQMRAVGDISHQFQGEPDLTQRASSAGAKFSRVAENVATSGSILQMHTALMNSPHHRENILDPKVNTIGISVVASGRQLWGVEDFARDVQSISLDQQEQQVSALIAAAGITNIAVTQDARDTCRQSTGYVGDRPAFVMRYTTSDLNRLPNQLSARLSRKATSMRFREKTRLTPIPTPHTSTIPAISICPPRASASRDVKPAA